MKHPKHVEGWDGSLQELAFAVGNMTYDKLSEFLRHLSDDLKRQAEGDRGRNRPKLANALDETANRVEDAQLATDHVWFICKPFMNEEINP